MDNSEPLSAGHLLVKELEAHGVQRTYLVPGESYLDVIDGLYDSSIRPIVCRQEGGAGYMAVAEGRMTGIPGIAMVTRGPGASNVMAGIHTAYQDATPLVVFVGLIPTAQRGRESFQEFDLNGWFSTTTKKVLTLDDPDKAAEVVADAMHTAGSGRPGPVVVGLPEEVLVQASAGTIVAPRVHGSATPYSGDVTELRARILQADRPVLIIGGEDWSPATSRRIAQWSRDRGLGVIGTFRAYDGIDHDSPNFLGILGFGASAVSKRTFAEADLHIFLGCVRTDVATESFTIGTAAKTVVIGSDSDAHGHFGSLDQHIVTSVNRFAQALFTADGSRAYSVSSDGSIDEPSVGDEHLESSAGVMPLPEWILDARAELEEWRVPQTATATSGDTDYVDMDEAFVHVKALLPENAIITYGAGNFSGWATRFLPTHGFPSALGPRNGSMGFGLPAAVAAGLVHPERAVFCITGDGDFLMTGQELATAVQYGVNLTIVVNDNSVYGTIRGHQDREYPGRATATALHNPDFAAMATAFGALGLKVERTEDFREAFDAALAHEGPALVHCITDPSIRGARV